MQAMHASALAAISAMVSLPASSGIGDEWFARSELGPEPTCALFGRAAVEPRMVMSSPDGQTLEFSFGGAYSKASAAMLAACRATKFGSPEKTRL